MLFRLTDRNPALVDAWEYEFKNRFNDEEISVFEFWETDDIFSEPADCIISPANSFGFMQGGFDGALTNFFGLILSNKIQEKIILDYDGELLVGQAIVVFTENNLIPHCICAPTMRTPKDITGTPNVYLATCAILRLLNKTRINSAERDGPVIVIPGMGTGAGGLTPEDCAHQMAQAFEDIWFGGLEFPATLRDAMKKEMIILG